MHRNFHSLSCHSLFLLLLARCLADLATEQERKLTTAGANQATGLTNGRRQIGHWKSNLVLSACFPIVK